MKNSGQKYVSWLGRGFLFGIQLFICASWFADEAAAPPAHQERARWGWEPAVVCSGMYWMVKVRHPLLESRIPWEVPTLHIHICTAPPPAPPAFFPFSPHGSWQGIPRWLLMNAKGPLFLGGSRGEQPTGCAHRGWQSKGGDMERCLDII